MSDVLRPRLKLLWRLAYSLPELRERLPESMGIAVGKSCRRKCVAKNFPDRRRIAPAFPVEPNDLELPVWPESYPRCRKQRIVWAPKALALQKCDPLRDRGEGDGRSPAERRTKGEAQVSFLPPLRGYQPPPLHCTSRADEEHHMVPDFHRSRSSSSTTAIYSPSNSHGAGASSACNAAPRPTAPPLCPVGSRAVRSSHSASGWDCSTQTPSEDQYSDSSSTTGTRGRGMGGGGMGGGGLGSGYGGSSGQ
jgi:hypothetical protein